MLGSVIVRGRERRMAGLGFGPFDFALFEIDDPDERGAALEATLLPKLLTVGTGCVSGLSRVAGKQLFLHPAKLQRRRSNGKMATTFTESSTIATSTSPRAPETARVNSGEK